MTRNKERIKKIIYIFGAYFLISLAFFYIAGEQIQIKETTTPAVYPNSVVGELYDGTIIRQEFICNQASLEGITISLVNYTKENTGSVTFTLFDVVKNIVLEQKRVEINDIISDMKVDWKFNQTIKGIAGETLALEMVADSAIGKGIAVYYDSQYKNDNEQLFVNGEAVAGKLDYQLTFVSRYYFGQYYWAFVLALAFLLAVYCVYSWKAAQSGKFTLGIILKRVWDKYGFLIRQLVSRDFKTKYKRSVLGYLWSFLNPLLTMVVQYIVFSTIFKSNIQNFPVYLLSAIVLFGFFTDSVGQGLTAIVANASLITKVYVPKYIYPVTKVVSCSINLFISLIPLFIVVLLTGQKITKAAMLLIFPLFCLLVFCVGMTFILCTSMVFFRDTQYLWGIATLAWTYATPMFYPETIIPEKFRFIQTYNPMYHFIKFTRTVLIEGISPVPEEYLYCLIFAFGTLFIGALIFKKYQNKFVLYI